MENKSKYQILKQEIIKTFPELKEFTNGCIIESPRFNVFSQKFEKDIFDEYFVFNGSIYDYFTNEIKCHVSDFDNHFTLSDCRIGKEPMLNDVLRLLMYSGTDVQSINIYGVFHDNKWHGLGDWDLKKPYLKDQSDDLIQRLIKLVGL